jgi:hypothetical protein
MLHAYVQRLMWWKESEKNSNFWGWSKQGYGLAGFFFKCFIYFYYLCELWDLGPI